MPRFDRIRNAALETAIHFGYRLDRQKPVRRKHSMKRIFAAASAALLLGISLAAQSPQGWKVRADRSTTASDPDAAGSIHFTTMGRGFHAVNPQAAVYWNPSNTARGNYTLKGTFTL